MSGDGWAAFGRELLKGPRWLWVGILVLTSIRLFFLDGWIGRALAVETWGDSPSINVGASFLFVFSASFLAFDAGTQLKRPNASWTVRRNARRKDKEMSETFSKMSEAERAILRESLVTANRTVSIRDEQAHTAALQLQQRGVGRLVPRLVRPDFRVHEAWSEFLRRYAIGGPNQ